MVTLKDKGIVPTIKCMQTFRCSDETTAKESTKKYHTSTPSSKNPASNLSQEIEQPLSQNLEPEYVSTLCTMLSILLRIMMPDLPQWDPLSIISHWADTFSPNELCYTVSLLVFLDVQIQISFPPLNRPQKFLGESRLLFNNRKYI